MTGECSFDGYTIDPDDCTAYYHCSGRKLYHYRCGVASLFNSALLSCTAPTSDHQCSKVKTLPQIPPLGKPLLQQGQDAGADAGC